MLGLFGAMRGIDQFFVQLACVGITSWKFLVYPSNIDSELIDVSPGVTRKTKDHQILL